MKRILCAILAVLMLCCVGVATVSCGASIESMAENCKKLKEDGEIVDYEYIEAKKTLYAMTKDEKMFSAQEFETTEEAKATYEESKKALEELGDAGKDYVLKRNGKIVIASTSKDLYKKIV